MGDGLHTEKNAKHVGRLDVIASDSSDRHVSFIYIHLLSIGIHCTQWAEMDTKIYKPKIEKDAYNIILSRMEADE